MDREHERDFFQQEIQKLEQQLKAQQKQQPGSEHRNQEVIGERSVLCQRTVIEYLLHIPVVWSWTLCSGSTTIELPWKWHRDTGSEIRVHVVVKCHNVLTIASPSGSVRIETKVTCSFLDEWMKHLWSFDWCCAADWCCFCVFLIVAVFMVYFTHPWPRRNYPQQNFYFEHF